MTPFGAYYFNRLPFGIASAPASYQKAMDTIFQGLPNLYIYMDDLLVFTKDQSEHEKIVSEVLKRLHDNGMAISLGKCVWMKKEVKYLMGVITRMLMLILFNFYQFLLLS